MKTLRELREEKKISKKQFADAMGYPASNLSAYERLGVIPSVLVALDICAFFEVDPLDVDWGHKEED